MTSSIGTANRLSDEAVSLLGRRGLNSSDRQTFAGILEKAAGDLERNISAKQVLTGLSVDEISILSKGHQLARAADPQHISIEGALNLLHQPDAAHLVDLNNDGIVEVGAAKSIHFPPVNAPAFVREAWQEATKDMSQGDVMTMQLEMHSAIYGFRIASAGQEQPTHLSPEKQWSEQGISEFFAQLRAGLEFQADYEGGWSPLMLKKKALYERFAIELQSKRPLNASSELPVVTTAVEPRSLQTYS